MYARQLLLDQAEYEYCIDKSEAHAFFYNTIKRERDRAESARAYR